jgi:hypothetical protein
VRFIRPFVTALSVLALTAGAATAHPMPTASADGLVTAALASGHAVAVGHLVAHEDLFQEDEQEADESVDESEVDESEVDESEVDETEQEGTEESHCVAPEEATTDDAAPSDEDAIDETEEQVEEPNHGAGVCGAAQAETPDGYTNHGAYVSEVARDNHGAEQSAAARAKHSGDAVTAGATQHGNGRGHAKTH